MIVLFAAIVALFVTGALTALWHLRWVQRLPSVQTLGHLAGDIRCSVVIAAQNEEARLEQTVRRLLAQRDIKAEIIAVDDRSTDRTNEILQQLAKEDSRVRLIRVEKLPQGWLGKCHACHLGANEATGEWLLFTDGDCWLKEDVLSRALHLAECEGVDHVTVTAGLSQENAVLCACQLMFLLSISSWFSGTNRDQPKSHLGFGAFNLVRAAAYWDSGGYETLRLTVLDDVKLGLLLRRAGRRSRALIGGDDVTCYWGSNVAGMIKLMEKNYFAALEFKLSVALGISVFVVALLSVVVVGFVSGSALGLLAALSPFCLTIPTAILARRIKWPWWVAILVPFALPVFICALLNSTFKTLSQGGICWRHTFYPIEMLRGGAVN